MLNCKCIPSILKQLVIKNPHIKKASLQTDIISGKTYSEIYYTDERGKNRKSNIIHTHCPFCGVPYELTKEAGAEAGASAAMPGA